MVSRVSEQQGRLREAIDSLYSVFAGYPLRSDTGACPCCHEPRDEPRLHARPLRDLSAGDLQSYGHSALLTWGTAEDFKHFLPRLFEILADTSDLEWVDAPIIFAKLRHADWRDWPDSERRPVECYIATLWQWLLTDADCHRSAEGLLCAIAHAVDDLAPFLTGWRDSGMVGLRKLAGFATDAAATIARRDHLPHAFWSDSVDQMRQVIDWLLEPATRHTLEEAFFADPSQEMSTAVDWLDWLARFRKARSQTEE